MRLATILLVVLFLTVVVLAQSQEQAGGPAAPAPSQDQVLDDLMQERESAPVEPSVDPQTPGDPASTGLPAVQADMDSAILGVAPGQEAPTLRREGDFVVSRRGRLVRSPDGAHMLFVFEADSRESPEPPMVLQRCRMLQSMEEIVQQRGDDVVFTVSGQVHVYRGANYLLPTMMKPAIDRGHLQP